jgi:hypothetical protein
VLRTIVVVVNLVELAGIPSSDVEAIARVGASALISGRHELARQVFEGLIALEPERADFRLCLAIAWQKDDEAKAVDVLHALLARTDVDDATQVRALLLRAELTAKHDKLSARSDLGRAHELAKTSPDARAALEQG